MKTAVRRFTLHKGFEQLRKIDARRLRYFLAVAEELHFGRAARRLNMSQPPLSRQIHMLEEEIGALLFDRNKRFVRLTEAGEVLLGHMAGLLTSLDNAVTAVRDTARRPDRRVMIGYSGSALYSRSVTAALATYRARYADVHLELHEGTVSTQVERILSGSLDMAILRGPLPKSAQNLECIPVEREDLVAALPATHRLAKRERLAISDLLHEPLVVYPRASGTSLYEHIRQLYLQRGAQPMVAMETLLMSSILNLVEAGLGASIVPRCVPHLASSIAVRPLSDHDAYSDLYVVLQERRNTHAQQMTELLCPA